MAYQQGSAGKSAYESRSTQQAPRNLDTIWPNYLKEGYLEADGALRPELIKRSNIVPLVEELVNRRLSSTQLRRFFQHCRAIERSLRSNSSNWGHERTTFKSLDYFAEYSFNKPKDGIPELFLEFIKRNVDKVKTKEDFLDGFMKHFEAFVGFFPPAKTNRRD